MLIFNLHLSFYHDNSLIIRFKVYLKIELIMYYSHFFSLFFWFTTEFITICNFVELNDFKMSSYRYYLSLTLQQNATEACLFNLWIHICESWHVQLEYDYFLFLFLEWMYFTLIIELERERERESIICISELVPDHAHRLDSRTLNLSVNFFS